MEEFGYPRDNFSFVPGSPTTARDAYYRYVFTLVADNAKEFKAKIKSIDDIKSEGVLNTIKSQTIENKYKER